jgi:hypothetical protein
MGRYINKIPELLIQKMMRDKRIYSQQETEREGENQ